MTDIAEALEPQVRIYESAFGSLEDTSPEGYAKSLAPVVEYLIRQAQAEAWDEGYATCLGDFDIAARREVRSANPYRD